MAPRIVSSVSGSVPGSYRQELLVCQFTDMMNSKGLVWSGGNPFSFTLPVLLAQLSVAFLLSRTVYILLEPFKQSMLSAQLIAGIILGQSFFGRSNLSKQLFPPGGRLPLETLADFALLFHLFLLGIRVDPSMVKKTGRDAVAIGLTGFVLPFTLGIIAAFVVPHMMEFDGSIQESILRIVTINSLSSFPVITSLLADLNILNSDVGRTATLACSVNECCNYTVYALLTVMSSIIRHKQWYAMYYVAWATSLFVLYRYIARPWMLHVARHMPDGQPLKEIQFLSIMITTLMCGFFTELIGVPAGIGAFIFGMAIPDGPPVGSYLVQKIDTICTGLLLPAKFAVTGLNTDFFSIAANNSALIYSAVIILGYLGKFTGVLLSALYFQTPLRDAVSLALVMCCKGIIEVAIYIILKEDQMIDQEAYGLLLISMIVTTGIARPLLSFLYDPSRRYSSYQTNSVLYSNPKNDLRILVCVHSQDNVPTIISLLESSNPSRSMPISVFVLNLMELSGRAAAVLERNVYRGRLTSMRSRSEHIAKAFSYFAQKNEGVMSLQHFTSIAPYASMHMDICTIASDVMANILILPFHRVWEIDGTIGSNLPAIRTVNQNVITKAPCSVGILVDRGHIAGNLSILPGNTLFRITVLFLGGADDREALAYGSRMVGHPQIGLTLVWLRLWDHRKGFEEAPVNNVESSIDSDMISHFRANTIGYESVTYKEEMAKDAVGTTRVLRSLEEACDLCIVGRQHAPDSPLTLGLTDWSECPELGDIGDMLATSDFQFSLLVVRQRPPAGTGFSNRYTLQPLASSHGVVTN
ncbi:cation/H(+) antiporter 14 [Coffea eugenioides]|uniref:Cation/H(+) antiporter 14 n=1 Tax=Coffea arabica TaxID=13443 RepID=A0A6P6SYW7_COFAR|nr:cation/H(+) antiporter 14 [Coffea arabica]XP_027174664.1 cation/H(+) antiporter 14 [Coffea eugenioides]